MPFLVRLRPSYTCLLVAVSMASFANGLYAIWELVEFGFEHRASGSKGKAMPFGEISMLVAMLSMLGGVYWSSVDWRRSLLLFGAAALGIFSSIASAIRGAWISFPIGATVCVVYLIQRHINYRFQIGGAALAICVVLLFALLQTDLTSKRIETTSSEITVMLFNGVDASDATSLFESRDMWRAALTTFTERPLLGIGFGQMDRYFKEAHAAGLVSKYVVRFKQSSHTHAHSDYSHTAATRGLLGLMSLVLIYGVPLWLSFSAARRSPHNDSYRVSAYSGIMLILAYMTFSLTDSVLLINVTNGFFVMLCC